jgi:cytochrome bd-type quinol oxidase subunit 2
MDNVPDLEAKLLPQEEDIEAPPLAAHPLVRLLSICSIALWLLLGATIENTSHDHADYPRYIYILTVMCLLLFTILLCIVLLDALRGAVHVIMRW